MESIGRFRTLPGVAPHALAELLACPPEAESLLSASSECIQCEPGDVVFRQNSPCRGLFVVVSGDFMRKAERMDTWVTLGPARIGDLVDLAAALGDGRHTYTLTALTSGSLLLLPADVLHHAFEIHPPLRMRLLQELAREVSRIYFVCCISRMGRQRRRVNHSAE